MIAPILSPHSLNMISIRFALILVISLSFSSRLQANDFEVALSSETAQFTFRSDSSLIGWGGAALGLSLFYNEQSDFVTQVEILQTRQASSQNPLTLGVGVKGYAGRIDANGDDIFGLGIGGEIRYTIAGVMPMSFYLRGYIAPNITSFGETEGISDYLLGFQIEVLPQTTAFVGVRSFEVENESFQNYQLDDEEFHFGVRLTF